MQEDVTQPTKRITARSVVLGILLMPLSYYWVVQMEVVEGRLFSTSSSLFFNVVFCLFVLVLLNFAIGRFWPKVALTPSELIVVYVILSISSAVGGQGMVIVLVGGLGHAFQFATPENEWKELFHSYLPSWLVVDDAKALKAAYDGDSTLYLAEHIRAWMIPILGWTVFLFILVFVMLCINVILRRQWIDRERLTYPIIQLPLQMAFSLDASSMFRGRLMWIGFGIAACVNALNGLHFLYPSFPGMQNIYNISNMFSEKPWNSMASDGIFIAFYPCAVGLAFLMPLDMAFSVWFFYFFWLGELLLSGMVGLRSMPGFPYSKYQASGACIGIGLLALWASKRQLGDVFKRAFSSSAINDSKEPMGYRTAVLGLATGLTLLVLFCIRMGIALWVAVMFLVVYFIVSIAVTRMRAELGPFYHEFYYGGASQVLTAAFGTRRIGPASLTGLSLFWGITRAQSSHPMPHQLEGFKLGERSNTSYRGLRNVIILATALGIVLSFWILLHVYYREGIHGTLYGDEPFERLENWLRGLSGSDRIASAFMGFGCCFTFIIMMIRRRWVWWPFHPLGYVVTQGDWGIKFLWFSVFISSIIKWQLLRQGGVKAYRKALPLFMGLILGDFIAGGAWHLIGWVIGTPTYSFKNW